MFFRAPAISEVLAEAIEFFRRNLVKNEAKVRRRLLPPEYPVGIKGKLQAATRGVES
jgi:hypothetical protein